MHCSSFAVKGDSNCKVALYASFYLLQYSLLLLIIRTVTENKPKLSDQTVFYSCFLDMKLQMQFPLAKWLVDEDKSGSVAISINFSSLLPVGMP